MKPQHFPKPNVSSPLDKPKKSSYIRNMNFYSVFTEARCGVRDMEGVPAPVELLSMTGRQACT